MFKKFKRSKDLSDRKAFLKSKHAIKKKLKLAHDKYLEDLLGIHEQGNSQEDSKSTFSRNKLFSIIKHSRQDSPGISPLKQGDSVYTSTEDKANALNRQLQSVFSIRSPLDFAQLCQSAVCDCISLFGNRIPDRFKGRYTYSSMPEIKSAVIGVAKLLSNLKIAKADGPDAIKPVVLKELSPVIASAIADIF